MKIIASRWIFLDIPHVCNRVHSRQGVLFVAVEDVELEIVEEVFANVTRGISAVVFIQNHHLTGTENASRTLQRLNLGILNIQFNHNPGIGIWNVSLADRVDCNALNPIFMISGLSRLPSAINDTGAGMSPAVGHNNQNIAVS